MGRTSVTAISLSHAGSMRKRVIFNRTLLRYVRLMARAVRLSSVCLSSVTLLHSRQRLEHFGNILHSLIAQGKNSKGSRGSCKLYEGYEKLAFNISLYFENGTRYSQSYNRRRIRLRMQSIEWCHNQ